MTGALEVGQCQGCLHYLFVLTDCIVPEIYPAGAGGEEKL